MSKYEISLSNPDWFQKPVRIGEVSVDLWGTGTPLREFLWSEEMADACVFLIENINFEDVNPTKSGQPLPTRYAIGIST